MLKIGTTANPGEDVTAAKWNQFLNSIRRALRIKPGPGVNASWTPDGICLAMTSADSPFVLARIKAVYGTSPGLATGITYDAEAIEETGCQLLGVKPVRGRPVNTAQESLVRIYAAAVNSLCFIVRNKQPDGSVIAELWLPQGAEQVKFRKCGT